MKKLTKLNLEELSKNLPTLSQEEQQTNQGGYYCFDAGGNYLGKTGDNPEVRVMTSSDYNQNKSMGEYGIMAHSQALYSAGSQSKEQIIKRIGTMNGYNVEVDYGDQSIYGWVNPTGNGGSGSIVINANSYSNVTCNYYDYVCTMMHEQQHINTPDDAGTAFSEYQAYNTVINSSAFQYASSSYRQGAIMLRDAYGELLGY